MEIPEMLDELKEKALKDEALRNELLMTKKEPNPLTAFCAKCRELGYEVYDMDLLTAGEELYAAMKRSTNGGEKILLCWRGKMIFMNYFSPVWKCVQKKCSNNKNNTKIL